MKSPFRLPYFSKQTPRDEARTGVYSLLYSTMIFMTMVVVVVVMVIMVIFTDDVSMSMSMTVVVVVICDSCETVVTVMVVIVLVLVRSIKYIVIIVVCLNRVSDEGADAGENFPLVRGLLTSFYHLHIQSSSFHAFQSQRILFP